MMILNLSWSLAKPQIMAKLNMAHSIFMKSKKTSKTAAVLNAGVTVHTIWCRNKFGRHVVQA